MENILNFIEEEKKKFDAEKIRQEKEYQERENKKNEAFDILREKLLPLENLLIDNEKCAITNRTKYNNSNIQVEYGKVNNFRDYSARSKLRININYIANTFNYDIEGDFLYHVCNNSKGLDLKHLLIVVAKFLAQRK